ncbi:MAG: hypothetical protein IKG27_01260 [Bacilli bacterium]|nr:hypothetical protein [Bacilli bacterium]
METIPNNKFDYNLIEAKLKRAREILTHTSREDRINFYKYYEDSSERVVNFEDPNYFAHDEGLNEGMLEFEKIMDELYPYMQNDERYVQLEQIRRNFMKLAEKSANEEIAAQIKAFNKKNEQANYQEQREQWEAAMANAYRGIEEVYIDRSNHAVVTRYNNGFIVYDYRNGGVTTQVILITGTTQYDITDNYSPGMSTDDLINIIEKTNTNSKKNL